MFPSGGPTVAPGGGVIGVNDGSMVVGEAVGVGEGVVGEAVGVDVVGEAVGVFVRVRVGVRVRVAVGGVPVTVVVVVGVVVVGVAVTVGETVGEGVALGSNTTSGGSPPPLCPGWLGCGVRKVLNQAAGVPISARRGSISPAPPLVDTWPGSRCETISACTLQVETVCTACCPARNINNVPNGRIRTISSQSRRSRRAPLISMTFMLHRSLLV